MLIFIPANEIVCLQGQLLCRYLLQQAIANLFIVAFLQENTTQLWWGKDLSVHCRAPPISLAAWLSDVMPEPWSQSTWFHLLDPLFALQAIISLLCKVKMVITPIHRSCHNSTLSVWEALSSSVQHHTISFKGAPLWRSLWWQTFHCSLLSNLKRITGKTKVLEIIWLGSVTE